jgi:phosphoribosyl-AMP cyclohydrolase/phosphoribosyl-ATP pyrophosphohydrolase/phosphoribosyl-AMP cyclohydrolase
MIAARLGEAEAKKMKLCGFHAVLRLLRKGMVMTMEYGKYFQKGDLVPAIVQDAKSGEVLMLAYMNGESLRRTVETGYTWFYSRSRDELWQKGETSGHVQRVLSVVPDCDDDTLLVKVEQTGAACHTGHRSCFFQPPIFVAPAGETADGQNRADGAAPCAASVGND